jgi:hypothetical protein
MIYFRLGCYVLIATCFLHLIGHFKVAVPTNDTEKQLLDLMANYQIDVGNGDTITMQGLQKGFSLFFSLFFLWSGSLSLLLSHRLAEQKALLRNISFINTISLGIGTGISLVYFFLIPTACIAVAFLFFTIASSRINK